MKRRLQIDSTKLSLKRSVTEDLLIFMLELLGELVSLTLETLSLRLVSGSVAHARALRVGVSVVHR